MPANIREMLIGFGKKKQDDLATANTLAGIWRLGKLNTTFMGPKLNTEDDRAELGKGHEFPTALYKTSWDVAGQIEKYLSAEFAAWAMAFGLGVAPKTGTPPNYIYTCTPLDPVTNGIELPSFSYIETIRQGASDVLDRMAVGCVVEGWTLSVASGPGRANSKLTVDIVGSGNYTEPSGITLPAATAEKLLPSASLTATINGIDYVTAKNLVSLEASWKNNIRLDSGFYPGSDFQETGVATSGAIRGRMEMGDRECALSFIARFENGSTEYTKLTGLTEGTAVISLSYDTNNKITLTYQRVIFSVVELGETDGIVTVQVTCTPLMHSANGLLSVVAKCNIDAIMEAE
ncbi:MAG: hypothetical protein JW730_18200 [Anaerolineales bacterium]|nr:hypothetical protein [Anaerolineales bacterium]